MDPLEITPPDRERALRAFLAPIQTLIDDATVVELCINEPKSIWTEQIGVGTSRWLQHLRPELSLPYCQRLARLIATFSSKPLGEEEPILSAMLPDGTRVEIAVPPVTSPDRIAFTMRKHAQSHRTLDQLDAAGAFRDVAFQPAGNGGTMVASDVPAPLELRQLWVDRDVPGFLRAAVRDKQNILIAGKTQSGKTSLLRALLELIPASERLVTIEDVAELRLENHGNKVHLFFAREGEAGASASALLRACVRHRPDRILLGELRDEEALVFLQSLNTGHPGSMTTVHASGAERAFRRVVDLIMKSAEGRALGAEYVLSNLIDTIDIVVYCESRRIRAIYHDPQRTRNSLG